MFLSKISSAINAENQLFIEQEINWLLTDSRSLSFPAETLFFAIRTARNDGHRYISELYRQNVRSFVVMPDFVKTQNIATMPDATFLVVENTLDALQKLVATHRQKFNIPIIGITGSNGKTVVKEWLYSLLQSDLRIVRSPRSYNSQIGVPLSVWALSEQSELGIFEAGISKGGEMAHLQPIIAPTIGVFTNLGEAHQENFSSLKEKCFEKLQLFKNAEILIYCADNKLVDISVQQANLKAKLFSWGKSASTNLQILKIEKQKDKTEMNISCPTFSISSFQFSIPFTDNASIENALHCIAVMLYLKYSPQEIAARLSLLEPVSMRLELKEGVHNCLIINDTYNSDLNSLNIALDFMTHQAAAKNLSRTVILSDILQSGLPNEELYENVAKLIKNKAVTYFIGIGKEITNYKLQITEILGNNCKSEFYEKTADFLSTYPSPLTPQCYLLKGSRAFHFEEISRRLEAIAHETVLDVNLAALVENLNYFRSKLRPETKIICMVKAFAYGSGAVEVAQILQRNHADYLAVAVADEGAELRQKGIRTPILVMNPEKSGFAEIFDNALEPEIYSFKLLREFVAATEKNGLRDYPIHIKIDSGMHRLGFEEKDISELIQILKNQTFVKVRSVFSHLAGADENRFNDFTQTQFNTFSTCADQISAAFSHRILRHILNSAGIERFADYQCDMVRLGIGMYGISALENLKLQQVCSLKTVILQIKTVKTGETVGYSRKGVITSEKRIAILPIGYADGFDRRLGNGVGEVFINGKRAKTVGNVCMDLTMVDVTDIEVVEGDKVEIFGNNILINDVAQNISTISYEILTGISRRVKRIYFQE